MDIESLPPCESQMDEEAALNALAGNRELLCDLAEMFREDAPQLLDALDATIANEDSIEARRAVHSLKGCAATFFAQPTVELAQRLEGEVASGHLDGLRDGGTDTLRQSVMRLIAELKTRGLTA